MLKILYRAGFLALMIYWMPLANWPTHGWAMDNNVYENVYIDQFVKMMDQKDFILINVHVPYYAEIARTDLLIPFNSVEQYTKDLPGDKNTRIVVYCLMGPMGEIAAEKLTGMGYTRVSNFQGGMMAWSQAGRSLQRRNR